MRIIDDHVHISPQFCGKFAEEFLEDGAVIQAVWHREEGALYPRALELKKIDPDRFFVFAAPNASYYGRFEEDLGRKQKEYAEKFISEGCDGIKMLEGKPQMRKMYPIPDFDDRCWEEYWDFVESDQIPVMLHINDPETFWGDDVSPWLKSQGWFYDDSYVNNEDQYDQILNVLERHPKLNLIFAHFFFMSAKLERLDGILDRYPNVKVDLTPGIEMYENFSANIEETRKFFAKHIKKICYGTDIGGRCILNNEGRIFNEKENVRRPEIVKAFLTEKNEKEITSDGNFLIDREPFIMKGLGLEGKDLEDVMGGNINGAIRQRT